MRSLDREIRLLDLLPGGAAEPIQCTTRVIRLDEHPDFETLSYVWGDRTEEESIHVSGRSIQVTRNLHAGLLRLRHSAIKRTLWIDQICINQWDLEEKAAQVALMRDIYKQCTRCVTWMGELAWDDVEVPVRDAEAVFDFLRQAAAALIVPVDSLPVLFQDSEEGSAARRAFGLFSMYGNPWWSRIWTVQEAIIPPSGILVWGPLSISRETVLTAARNLRELNSWSFLPKGYALCRYRYTELLRRLLYPVHGFNHSRLDNALNLLMRWRHREYTDARDKVYGLLGLIAPDAIPSAQHCDYIIAVPQLFAQVTKDLIRHEDGLRPFLGACEMPDSTAGIPSWAIDFAQCNHIGKRQLKWWGHSHRYKVFSACGDRELEIVSHPKHHVLGLRGVYIDEVVDTTELLRVGTHDPIQFEGLSEPLLASFQLLERYRVAGKVQDVYKDGFTWYSAFCRTLVGDLIMDEIPTGRIASYGRFALESMFQDLFHELRIPLGSSCELDFLAFSTLASPCTPSSYDYSPTSPTHEISPASFQVSTHASGRDSLEDERTVSHNIQEMVNIAGPANNSLQVLQSTYSVASLDSASVSSQQSYTSDRPARYQRRSRKSSVSNVSQDRANANGKARHSLQLPLSYTGGSHRAGQQESAPKDHSRKARQDDEQSLSETSGYVRDIHSSNSGGEVFTDLHESLIGMMENQTFFITKSGLIGIGPPQTSSGDQVWVLNGGNVPFVLRKINEDESDRPQLALIGDAYVHGVMDGEYMTDGAHVQTLYIH